MSIFNRTIKTKHIGEISKTTFKKNKELIDDLFLVKINHHIDTIKQKEKDIGVLNKKTTVTILSEEYVKIMNGHTAYLEVRHVKSKKNVFKAIDIIYLYSEMENTMNEIKRFYNVILDEIEIIDEILLERNTLMNYKEDEWSFILRNNASYPNNKYYEVVTFINEAEKRCKKISEY